MQSIAIENDTHWHKLRQNHVGASEVAALFDVSPYMTRFQLWHEKKGTVPPSFEATEQMNWGNYLEEAIAIGIAKEHGLDVEKCLLYFTGKPGMGATPDFFLMQDGSIAGLLEIKNVSWDAWKSKWFNDAGEIEPPVDLMLQVQHQLAVTGYTHAKFGVLVGGHQSFVIPVERHDGAVKMIEDAVAAFWESIWEGVEPEPFNAMDYATTLALFNQRRKPDANLSGHAHLPTLCEQFLFFSEKQRQAKKSYDTAKTKILHVLHGATGAVCENYQIRFNTSTNRLTVTQKEN